MNLLTETTISCPYCGEAINVLINAEDLGQGYIEDCQVCCKPITLVLSDDSGEITVSAYGEDESF
ncbi:CPXCG motif-containing cysteine-rich protein [Dasania marina]|uniref:CPXCG motif-containing cysteine-rich protein n=1 Tax=Dasania marina TaxID=471499 RepID=UPI0030DA7897|tara:strand:+ start:77159 stop:77353 length:195 start_codon:yes stop_codon:yes gene_type:complete